MDLCRVNSRGKENHHLKGCPPNGGQRAVLRSAVGCRTAFGNEAAEPVGLADAGPVVAAFPMRATVHRLARIVGGNVEADVEATCRERWSHVCAAGIGAVRAARIGDQSSVTDRLLNGARGGARRGLLQPTPVARDDIRHAYSLGVDPQHTGHVPHESILLHDVPFVLQCNAFRVSETESATNQDSIIILPDRTMTCSREAASPRTRGRARRAAPRCPRRTTQRSQQRSD